MKKIKVILELEVDDQIEPSDIIVYSNDTDGFVISRNTEIEDVIDNYHLKSCNIEKTFSEGTAGVYWSVVDFESVANNEWEEKLFWNDKYKNAESWQDVYDESKFQEALERMINEHDANNGINWQTVNCYLDNICLR